MSGFVSLDSIAIEPHFAHARQTGAVRVVELDESMLVSGLRAAARRLPFEVTRSGVGSDAVALNDDIRTIVSPYADGEELVAMPAIPLDLSIIHVSRADTRGNAVCLGPDPYFDDLFARAAQRTIVSTEALIDDLDTDGSPARLIANRTVVDAVVLAPGGAGFTAFPPHYERDEVLQRRYADSAASPQAWAAFTSEYLVAA